MEIETLGLKSVSNGAHFVFVESICKRLDSETELLKNEYFKKAADALKAAFNEENRYFALSKKSASTDEILAADADRDTLYSAYYRSVKSFLRVSSADLHTAAKTLWQSLVDYGIKPSMQLDRETGLLHNFIADLETKYAAEVTKLGLTLYVAPLKEANAKVEQFIVGRTTAQSAIIAGELRAARLATDAAYRHLVKFVNALAMVSGTSDYDALNMFLNEHIDRYKQEALPKAKKKDEGKNPAEDKKGKEGKKPEGGDKPKPDDKKPSEGGDDKGKLGGEHGSVTVTPKS